MDLCSAWNDAFDDGAAARQPHPGPDIAEAQSATVLNDGFGVETLPVIPDSHLHLLVAVIE